MVRYGNFFMAPTVELRQISAKRSEYKSILISKLSPKAKDSCFDLITSEGSTYEEIKATGY